MKMSRIPRTTIVYLIVIVVLAAVYTVQETRTSRRNAIPIPEIAAEVDRIVMEQPGADGERTRLEVYRDQDAWRVRTGDDASPSYRADAARVGSLLEDLEALSAADVMSTRATYEEYGLTEGEAREMRFFVGDTEPLALEFGGAAAAGDAVYGRMNGSREVVLLPRSLSSVLTTDPNELRDTAVVRVPEAQITQVEIRSPDQETLTLSRERPGESSSAAVEEDDPVWRVEPELEEEPIAPGRVRDLFTTLDPLRAEEFLSEEPEGSPFAEIIVRRSNNAGAEEIMIWPPDEDQRYPVLTSSAEEAVLIPEWRARRLLLGLERYFAPFVEAEAPATD